MIGKKITTWAIILAAGQGLRLSSQTQGIPKQFLSYNNLPLYYHCARTFSHNARIQGIIFVLPKEYLAEEKSRLHELEKQNSLGLPWLCVAGGKRRQDSVYEGLLALPPHCSHVLIHDSARPFMTAKLVENICTALEAGHAGVIPGLKLIDTIKQVENNIITKTLDRSKLFAVQTPQGFQQNILLDAHNKAREEDLDVTDDASLLEHCNHSVFMIEGESKNIKITEAEHMHLLNDNIATRPCSGFGYDVHRFGQGRPLKLGGVLMHGGMEVMAHSDGDVVLHAIMDAILGLAGLGDIGLHFPDSDVEFDNIDSAILLHNVLQLIIEKRIKITNIDVTIITQKPKIGPQRTAIVKNIAHLLNLPHERVNVKATTEEGLGFTGSGQGIKAIALVNALASE